MKTLGIGLLALLAALPSVAAAQTATDVAAEIQAEGGSCLLEVARTETGGTFNPQIVSDNGIYVNLFQFDERTWLSTSVGQAGVSRSGASVSQQVEAAKELLRAGLGRQSWPNTLPSGC